MFKDLCQKRTRKNYDCYSIQAKTHSLLNQSINMHETGNGVHNIFNIAYKGCLFTAIYNTTP